MALKLFKRFLALTTVVALTLFAVRAYDSQRGMQLDVWHTYVPHELSVKELEAADWSAYLGAEEKIFLSLNANVTGKLAPENRSPTIAILKAAPFTRDIFHKIEIDRHVSRAHLDHQSARSCFCTD